MLKKDEMNAGMDVEKREPLCAADGIVNWCGYHGKQYGGSSKKIKNRPTI